MKKNNNKEIVETTEVHKKVYKIQAKNKGMKKMSTKKLKAILYSTAVLATFSAAGVTSYATETQPEPVQEQNANINPILKISKSEKVAEFTSEKQLKNLLKSYPIFSGRTGEQIKNFRLSFRNPDFSLNDSKYLSLNNNEVPVIQIFTDQKSYDFKVKFAQNRDYLLSNHLAGHDFSYSHELPKQFLDTEIYKKLEGKSQIKGNIIWNKTTTTYHIEVMQYTLKNGQLELVFDTIGSTNYSQISMSDFEAAQK